MFATTAFSWFDMLWYKLKDTLTRMIFWIFKFIRRSSSSEGCFRITLVADLFSALHNFFSDFHDRRISKESSILLQIGLSC